jgi:hypothetical protein
MSQPRNQNDSMGKITLTLTLNKTAEGSVDDYLTFTGEFNGHKTAPSAAHVYTDTPAQDGTVRYIGIHKGRKYGVEALSEVRIRLGRGEGTGVAYVNGKKIETVTCEDKELTLDLSALEEGKHTVTAGIVTSTGDLIYTVFYITYQNDVVIFDMN